jgi:uncharacterized protein (DUF362 family)
MITDGVIGGEGDGPLSPRPVRFGYLSFSDDVVPGDRANALAMGFDPDELPMLRGAIGLGKYPLTDTDLENVPVSINGRSGSWHLLRQGFGRKFVPASEWRSTL